MGFRRSVVVLAIVVSSFVVGWPALAHATAPHRWRTVTFRGVSLQVPRAWKVLNLSRHPAACPRLDIRAVYLGSPGPHPSCPAGAVGRAEAVWIRRVTPAGPEAREATAATTIAGQPGRTSPGSLVHHPVTTDVLPGADAEISIYNGGDLALARRIRATIRVRSAAGSRRGRPAVLGAPLPRPAKAPAQALYVGGGFDTCAAPAATVMTDWLASPYRAVGIYIGGINRACAQANLTAGWITAIQRQGWHYFPFYAGLQATCVQAGGDATINPKKAAAQGKAAAMDAASQAENLGIPHGTPIIYDMEAYAGCGTQVVTFLSAWDSELKALHYQAAVYESFSNIGDLVKAAATMTEPDVIHYADWDGKATTTSSYMPATMWTKHQRIHQYQGGHNERWGGATVNIDNDQLDTVLGGGNGSIAPARGGFRIAVGSNVSKSPEWFARAANGTLVHDYQHPDGSQAWSGVQAVGESPSGIAGNPAVTADADGSLTLFARSTAGQVVHAWQQPGAPNGWQWGGPVAADSTPGSLTGDPAAVRRPGGAVQVFVTGSGGAVSTTWQVAPNADSAWTPWQSIGGSCASSPVPLVAHRRLAVFCVTTAGTAAVDHRRGGSWRGWHAVGASPTGLAADPAVVADGAGQTEVFAATTAHGLDYAWQDRASGQWTWGAPLAGGSSGQRIRRSPAAIRWPDGGVRVFAQLTSGQLGVISQQGTAGSAAWSAWAAVGGAVPGGTMLGSPAGWISASGVPAAGALDGGLRMASSSFAGGAWSTWTEFGGHF
jgi:Domain of unknown function (DUF1906)